MTFNVYVLFIKNTFVLEVLNVRNLSTMHFLKLDNNIVSNIPTNSLLLGNVQKIAPL